MKKYTQTSIDTHKKRNHKILVYSDYFKRFMKKNLCFTTIKYNSNNENKYTQNEIKKKTTTKQKWHSHRNKTIKKKGIIS